MIFLAFCEPRQSASVPVFSARRSHLTADNSSQTRLQMNSSGFGFSYTDDGILPSTAGENNCHEPTTVNTTHAPCIWATLEYSDVIGLSVSVNLNQKESNHYLMSSVHVTGSTTDGSTCPVSRQCHYSNGPIRTTGLCEHHEVN